MKINNKIVTDPITIDNEFNKFFANIGPNLENLISNVDGDISDYLDESFQISMCAIHTDPIEIQIITNHLKSSSSKGVDGVSPKMVKKVIEATAQPLATVFNISLANGLFLDKLKIGNIIPAYKSEERLLTNNYHPISVLPFFHKIFEHLMYNWLTNYLVANKILVDNQFDFCKEHSTYMALLKVINDIANELENKNYSLGVFIDLSKAFDMVDKILCQSNISQ